MKKQPSNSSDKYFSKELKMFKHPRLDGLVLGLPAVNRPVIQDLYTLRLSSVGVVPGTVGEFADLELYENSDVKKITDKVETRKLVDLNWPDWESR